MSRHGLEFGVGANDLGNGLFQDNRPQLFHVWMWEHKLARVDIDRHVVIDDYFFRVAVVVEDQAVDAEVVDGLVGRAEDLVYELGVVLDCAEHWHEGWQFEWGEVQLAGCVFGGYVGCCFAVDNWVLGAIVHLWQSPPHYLLALHHPLNHTFTRLKLFILKHFMPLLTNFNHLIVMRLFYNLEVRLDLWRAVKVIDMDDFLDCFWLVICAEFEGFWELRLVQV